MKNEQILDGNAKIAAFIGWKNIGMKSLELWIRFENDFGLNTDELTFHSSWDWLMPIVVKIEEMPIYNKFIIETGGHFGKDDLVNHKYIESTWKNIVEFIEWYNQNKPS